MTEMGLPSTLYEYTVEPLIRDFFGEITHYKDEEDDFEWRKQMLWDDIFRDPFFECWYFCSEWSFDEPTFVWSNDNWHHYLDVMGEIARREDIYREGVAYELAHILEYTGELLESDSDYLLACLSGHPFKGSLIDFRNYLFDIRHYIIDKFAEIPLTKIALDALVDLVTVERLSPMNVCASFGQLGSFGGDLGYFALRTINDLFYDQRIEELVNLWKENPQIQISEEQISFVRELWN